jgi:hypothetical protein
MNVTKTLKTLLASLLISAGVLASSGAGASVTTYSSVTAFDAAMTGLTTTSYVNDGSGGAPPGYSSVSGTSPNQWFYYSTKPIAFNGGDFQMGAGYDWNNVSLFGVSSANAYGSSNYVANWAAPGIDTINFSSPVYGFALNGGVMVNAISGSGYAQTPASLGFTFGGSSATVNFADVMTYLNSSSNWTSTGQPLQFMGFSSSTPFTSVSVSDPYGGFSTQNITIATGTAQTVSSATTTTVPEPGSIVLLMLGGLGFIGAGRKIKNNGNHNGRLTA